jgi:hypothetical protein
MMKNICHYDYLYNIYLFCVSFKQKKKIFFEEWKRDIFENSHEIKKRLETIAICNKNKYLKSIFR